MGLHVGTVAGLFTVDGGTEERIGGTRINHAIEAEDVLWAVDGKGRVHRDDVVVANLPPGESGLCVQPAISATWIGAPAAKLYRLDEEGLNEDEFFVEAPGREAWYTPWGGPPDVRSMTLDADHTLFVNVHVGGILRYDNTGLVPTLDIGTDVHQVEAHPSQKGAIFAACAYGLAASRNGHDFEMRSGGLHARYCRAVAVAADTVFISASTGPSTQRARVYRGAPGEGPFEPMTSGLPEWFDGNVNTHCLLVDGRDVFIGFGDKVWVSSDLGESFEILAEGLPKVTCLA